MLLKKILLVHTTNVLLGAKVEISWIIASPIFLTKFYYILYKVKLIQRLLRAYNTSPYINIVRYNI